MKKLKRISKTESAAAIGIGVGACLLCLVLLAAVMASLVSNGSVNEKLLWTGVPVLLFLASNIGCIVAGRVGEGRRIMLCALTAGAFLLILFCGGILFFDLSKSGVWLNAVAILASVLTAAVLSKPSRKKRRSR